MKSIRISDLVGFGASLAMLPIVLQNKASFFAKPLFIFLGVVAVSAAGRVLQGITRGTPLDPRQRRSDLIRAVLYAFIMVSGVFGMFRIERQDAERRAAQPPSPSIPEQAAGVK